MKRNDDEYLVISKNEKRNMQMVVTATGKTHHIAIDKNKPTNPKTGPKNPKGLKDKK